MSARINFQTPNPTGVDFIGGHDQCSQSHRLPDELVLEVFGRLTPQELYRAGSLSREWRRLAGEPILWNRFFRDCPPTNSPNFDGLISSDPKKYYVLLPFHTAMMEIFNFWETHLRKITKIAPEELRTPFSEALRAQFYADRARERSIPVDPSRIQKNMRMGRPTPGESPYSWWKQHSFTEGSMAHILPMIFLFQSYERDVLSNIGRTSLNGVQEQVLLTLFQCGLDNTIDWKYAWCFPPNKKLTFKDFFQTYLNNNPFDFSFFEKLMGKLFSDISITVLPEELISNTGLSTCTSWVIKEQPPITTTYPGKTLSQHANSGPSKELAEMRTECYYPVLHQESFPYYQGQRRIELKTPPQLRYWIDKLLSQIREVLNSRKGR